MPRQEVERARPAQPQPLTAAEVTEPGWYWYWDSQPIEPLRAWEVVQVIRASGSCLELRRADLEGAFDLFQFPGTFIGPLRPPTD